MPNQVTLTFNQPLNASVQVGDTAYYSNDVNGETLLIIGPITQVLRTGPGIPDQIVADLVPNIVGSAITTSSFILFSKTALVNTSGLKGYYAEAQFKNDSTDYAELFLVGSEVFESSK